MNLIGLTGGIGSGKTMAANMFRTLGIPVYDSDTRAKELMNNDADIHDKIIHLFGPNAYQDRLLNRKWIATQVFSDKEKLESLNNIVHPAVFNDLKNWAQEDSQLAAPYLIQESAILFEENLIQRFKYVITVVALEELRIARVMDRDKVDAESVKKRISHQWPDEKKIPLSDFLIYNDGERSLITQVKDIDQMIRSLLSAKDG